MKILLTILTVIALAIFLPVTAVVAVAAACLLPCVLAGAAMVKQLAAPKSERLAWRILFANAIQRTREVLMLPAVKWQRWGTARAERRALPDLVYLANIAEGTHDGNITKQTDVAITERFLLAKIGSTAARVDICTAADIPIGVIADESAAIGDSVNVKLLGSSRTTLRMVASGAIAQGALIEPAAAGRVQTKGVGAGTHWVVGRALDAAAAAGDVIEVDPIAFMQII
jgi:hypothetical protein